MKKPPRSAAASPPAVAHRRPGERRRPRRPIASSRAKADTARLVHDLEVHQIELEQQNQELIAARTRLEDSLANYTDLYESTPVSHLTLRADGVILQANLTAAAYLGIARARLIGRTFGVFTTLDSRPVLAAFVRSVCSGEYGVTCEVTLALDGREPRRARLLGGAMVRKPAEGHQARVVLEDITERERAEATVRQLNAALEAQVEALRRSEARFRAIAAHTPDHVLVQDRDLRYEMVINPQLGLSEADMLGKTDAEFLSPADAAKITAIKRQVLATGESLRVEESVLNLAGQPEFFEGTYVPLRDAQGQIEGLIGYFHNVTERRKSAAALARSREALRALAARLAATREQERQHLAREIHDTFGHALTEWKLDLAWLGRRLAAAGIGKRSSLGRKIAAMGRRAEAEMESVRRLAGELRPALLDTAGLVSAIEWLAREFQARTRVPCRVDLPSIPPPLGNEPATALYRILQELLDNVTRHARARQVAIRLAVDETGVALLVRDDGCGISERAANDTASLGLLGIRERAAAFGGEVAIRGVQGQGTTVTVRFPRLEANQET